MFNNPKDKIRRVLEEVVKIPTSNDLELEIVKREVKFWKDKWSELRLLCSNFKREFSLILQLFQEQEQKCEDDKAKIGKRLKEVNEVVITTREELQKTADENKKLIEQNKLFMAGAVKNKEALTVHIEFLEGMIENNGDEVERELKLLVAGLKTVQQNLISLTESKK